MNLETLYRALCPACRRSRKRLIRCLFVFVVCGIGLPSCAASAQAHVGNVLNGEAKLEILQRYKGHEMLPKPARIVIEDFEGKGPIVENRPLITGASPPHRESPDQLVQQIQDSLARTLIGQFRKMNVESERASDASAIAGPAIVIQGEFISIAPGNSRQRIIVGFGRGASDIKTHVTISEIVGGQKTVLLECNINSQSGKQPGAILSTSGTGFAVGIVTGHFGDKLSSTVKADASRMAKLIGKQTRAIMVAQQWITDPSAN
jgi:hypothetical protein